MAREKEDYRNNLERLCDAFPDKELLTKKDVIQFTGLNYRAVCRLYPFYKNYISKATLARHLS